MDKCENIVAVLGSSIHFRHSLFCDFPDFLQIRMLQKMRAIVGVGLAGQGGAVCVAPCSAGLLQPVLAPLSLKATNPAALYLVHHAHQPNFHLLQEPPRPRCVAYVPQMHVLVAAAPHCCRWACSRPPHPLPPKVASPHKPGSNLNYLKFQSPTASSPRHP